MGILSECRICSTMGGNAPCELGAAGSWIVTRLAGVAAPAAGGAGDADPSGVGVSAID